MQIKIFGIPIKEKDIEYIKEVLSDNRIELADFFFLSKEEQVNLIELGCREGVKNYSRYKSEKEFRQRIQFEQDRYANELMIKIANDENSREVFLLGVWKVLYEKGYTSVNSEDVASILTIYKNANKYYPNFNRLTKDSKKLVLQRAYTSTLNQVKQENITVHSLAKVTLRILLKNNLAMSIIYPKKGLDESDVIQKVKEYYNSNGDVKLILFERSIKGYKSRESHIPYDLWSLLTQKSSEKSEDDLDDEEYYGKASTI